MDRQMNFINSGAAAAWVQAGTNSTEQQQATRNGWENPQLTLLGLYFPLGPCKTTLKRSQLGFTLKTLREIFQKLSLETTYQDEPIMATCRTLDQVEFTVTIFQSRDDPTKAVMEMMRHSGDTMVYHSYARQIMAAVVSGRTVTTTTRPTVWCARSVKLAQKMEDTIDPAWSEGHELNEAVNGALEQAWNMISTDRFDAQRRGLESLEHMTDPRKSGWSTAKTVTERLLQPNGYPIQERISECLLELACQANPEFSADAPVDWAILALTILSQMFRIVTETKRNLNCKQQWQFLKNPQGAAFVECMLQKVHAAQGHPHEAYYATRCLTDLCLAAPDVVVSRVPIRAVQEAEQFGLSHHLALASASRELLLAVLKKQ